MAKVFCILTTLVGFVEFNLLHMESGKIFYSVFFNKIIHVFCV